MPQPAELTQDETIVKALKYFALHEAREAQTAYWNKLRVLEEALGCAVDGSFDLSEVSLEMLETPKKKGKN